MGNKETLKYESLNSSYRIISDDVWLQDLGLSHSCNLAVHKKTNQLFVIKKILDDGDVRESKIMQILENKKRIRSRYVTQIFEWWRNEKQDSCSVGCDGFLVMFLMENYMDVELDLLGEGEVERILECLLKGLKYYKKVNHQYCQISVRSILKFRENYVMVDPWLLEFVEQKGLRLKAPQRLLCQRDFIGVFNNFYANIFEIGLLMMRLLFGGQFERIYLGLGCDGFMRELLLLLEKVKNERMKQKLKIMLNLDCEKRMKVYEILGGEKINLRDFDRLKMGVRNTMNVTENNWRLDRMNMKKRVSLSRQKCLERRERNCSLGGQKSWNVLGQKRREEKSTSFNSSIKDSVLTYAQLLPGTRAYEQKLGLNQRDRQGCKNLRGFGVLKERVKGRGKGQK